MDELCIPLTVVGGYLGAGKTTLLNHLLRNAAGRRYAVLVNDFGSLNIDASLVEAEDGALLRLENGCVCCTIAGGMATALHEVAQLDPRPDHVIVEASGVSDPGRVAWYGHVAPFTPEGVVVVADAETVRERCRDPFVGDAVTRQLRAADLLVLNKIDLVGPVDLEETRAWLGQAAPGAAVLPTRHGEVPSAVLLGLPSRTVRMPEGTHPDYASWSFSSATPMCETALRERLALWPDEVLRAKGVVQVAEDPGRRYLFHRTGRRWSLVPDRDWGAAPPRTDIVLIGLAGHLEGLPLLRDLEDARAGTHA